MSLENGRNTAAAVLEPLPPTPENDSLYVSNTMPAASVLLGGHLLYL